MNFKLPNISLIHTLPFYFGLEGKEATVIPSLGKMTSNKESIFSYYTLDSLYNPTIKSVSW